MLIAEFMRFIETFAPLSLALDWDNSGLQVGDPKREVTRVLISLDATPNTADKAIELGADLILTHHPLLFRPLKQLTDPLLLKLIEHKIAVVSLHTNLDTASYSVNHALADKLGLIPLRHLQPETGNRWQHLSVLVPPASADGVAQAALAAGAGRIGNYDSCFSRHDAQGSFRPLPGANPHSQAPDAAGITTTAETELEFMVDSGVLTAVLRAIRASHPYETPLFYHHPVSDPNPAYGLGLVCRWEQPLSLKQIAELARERLQCPHPRLWTAGRDLDFQPASVAICGGAGASILGSAGREADLAITGDIGYHSLLESPLPILDAGHFYTEFPVLYWLKGRLEQRGIPCSVLPMAEHEYYTHGVDC